MKKNSSAGQIMSTAGKALAYAGHQRLTVRPPLVRLHHEVETFRARAITDTKATVSEMERARTEYRAALSWMKSASSQLDPDTGHGLERFRKAQSYVKTTKAKFDRLTLACLQKVDLLAAARCNMFSHALVPYQSAVELFSTKAAETLNGAVVKLENVQPFEFSTVPELVASAEDDKDKNTFFNAEYTDNIATKDEEPLESSACGGKSQSSESQNLLGEDFSESVKEESLSMSDDSKPSSALLDLNWTAGADFLGGDFMPSKLLQENSFDFSTSDPDKEDDNGKHDKKVTKATKINENNVSWLSLFAELDPLANPSMENNTAGDRV
ncbi:hypothetical protein NQ318_013524 [Aromia moschata]|uniref:AH domain-containing protein n=1 Tax=Aromia moschata TaxID=1265417 RepID=A0AAV8YEM9_9CUCU|nr:hypothetical protein NQ318_013524 [Aromia moschata]